MFRIFILFAKNDFFNKDKNVEINWKKTKIDVNM